MAHGFRVTGVRSDGLHHSSDFTGWDAETAMAYFRDKHANDKRTMAVFVFELTPSGTAHPRQNIVNAEFQTD